MPGHFAPLASLAVLAAQRDETLSTDQKRTVSLFVQVCSWFGRRTLKRDESSFVLEDTIYVYVLSQDGAGSVFGFGGRTRSSEVRCST